MAVVPDMVLLSCVMSPGTAAVTVAGMISCMKVTGKKMCENTFLFQGAGEVEYYLIIIIIIINIIIIITGDGTHVPHIKQMSNNCTVESDHAYVISPCLINGRKQSVDKQSMYLSDTLLFTTFQELHFTVRLFLRAKNFSFAIRHSESCNFSTSANTSFDEVVVNDDYYCDYGEDDSDNDDDCFLFLLLFVRVVIVVVVVVVARINISRPKQTASVKRD